MKALKGECLSININKFLAVLLLLVYLFNLLFYTALCCYCLHINSPFFVDCIKYIFTYFCLFVDHVNKANIFVFWSFCSSFEEQFFHFLNNVIQDLLQNFLSSLIDRLCGLPASLNFSFSNTIIKAG